jgi:hypothetical protein
MPYSADVTKILTRTEMQSVLADLRRKAPRSKNTRLNLVIFRLAACCGLRAKIVLGAATQSSLHVAVEGSEVGALFA